MGYQTIIFNLPQGLISNKPYNHNNDSTLYIGLWGKLKSHVHFHHYHSLTFFLFSKNQYMKSSDLWVQEIILQNQYKLCPKSNRVFLKNVIFGISKFQNSDDRIQKYSRKNRYVLMKSFSMKKTPTLYVVQQLQYVTIVNLTINPNFPAQLVF